MTLNEQEKLRLLQTLRDDPAFLASVRSLILPDELIQLPERFAQFAGHVMAFIETQQQFNADVTAFIKRQEQFNAGIASQLQRITDDLGEIKGHVASRIARQMPDEIAEHLGYQIIDHLDGKDLRSMLRQHNPTDISPGVRSSFYYADLVALVEDQHSNQLYIAAEASYTADQRDSQRAMRNAQFITRFTSVDAVPVIVSRENDYEVQQLIQQGSVRWFQLQLRHLQPQ